MTAHTPGPWHVGGLHKCTVYDEFGQRVADAFEGVMTTQRTDAGCRANARLIAAAPDLLDALIDAIGWVPFGNAWHTGAPSAAVARARSAIAKATGAQP